MEDKHDKIFGHRVMKHRICWNCGSVMIWDPINEIYRCHCCGNSESEVKELKIGFHSYIG